MKKTSIDIKALCGKNVVTREDGKRVHDKVRSLWGEFDIIEIDFGNVLVASVSFVDEIFGQLALEFGRQVVRAKLEVRNIREFDRSLVNDVFLSRDRQRQQMTSSQNVVHG